MKLPFYNVLAFHELLRRGHVDLQNFKSCRPFFARNSTLSCTVSCWNKCESFLFLLSLETSCVCQVFMTEWQEMIISFGPCHLLLLYLWWIVFCYNCEKSISVNILFWYLTDSCVIAHLTWFNVEPFWIVHLLRTVWALSFCCKAVIMMHFIRIVCQLLCFSFCVCSVIP